MHPLDTSSSSRDNSRPENLLRALFDAAVDAANPAHVINDFLPTPSVGRTIVVGAGKGSAAMALAVEAAWSPAQPLEGLVITPYGMRLPCEHIELVEARHPVPDEAGEQAARRILSMVSDLTADDLVLCLISGGGSALLTAPGNGITLQDLQQINAALLASGAAIAEMNCVRKHLSAIKGGRLAATAYPARTVTLAISDVPGDDPAVIASGPTVPNATTPADAQAILSKYTIPTSEAVQNWLLSPAANTPNEADPRLQRAENHLICTPQKSLVAAAEIARAHGITPLILGDAIEGEAREVAAVMAGIAQQVCRYDQPIAAPAVLISGGETTVTIRQKGGRGGRNAEFLLAFAQRVKDEPRISALACDTDGIDGSGDNAGAIWTNRVAEATIAQGLNSAEFLDRHDAYTFFEATDGLVMTGPTMTNVNDFRAILITK